MRLPTFPGHVFYRKLNGSLAEVDFDGRVDWQEYLKRPMQEEGLIDEDDELTNEDLRRFDQPRKNKKVSNAEWALGTDPSRRITKMKDGRTHLAYKAENVVDLETN